MFEQLNGPPSRKTIDALVTKMGSICDMLGLILWQIASLVEDEIGPHVLVCC